MLVKNTYKRDYDYDLFPNSLDFSGSIFTPISPPLDNLYNVNKEDTPTGTSTIGSTEAALLAALNYKFMWKKWAVNHGLSTPEIIMSENVQYVGINSQNILK